MLEKFSNKARQLLQSAKISQHHHFELIRTKYRIAPDTMIFHIVPYLFGWIKFRRIRGEKKDFKRSVKGLNAFLYFSRTVGWMTIPDQKTGVSALCINLFKKSQMRSASTHSLITINRICPNVLMAAIMFKPKRAPVA